MQFEDYNYRMYNPYILIDKKKRNKEPKLPKKEGEDEIKIK